MKSREQWMLEPYDEDLRGIANNEEREYVVSIREQLERYYGVKGRRHESMWNLL